MTEQYEISEEEKALASKTVVSSMRNIVDPDSADRKREHFKQQLLHRQQQESEYEEKIIAARLAKDTEERLRFERQTGGRKLRSQKHVFMIDSTCPYCDLPTKKVAPGWNGNKTMLMMTDLSIDYNTEIDSDYNFRVFHECITTDPVLAKQIKALKQEIKDSKTWTETYFKKIPTW